MFSFPLCSESLGHEAKGKALGTRQKGKASDRTGDIPYITPHIYTLMGAVSYYGICITSQAAPQTLKDEQSEAKSYRKLQRKFYKKSYIPIKPTKVG